MTGTFYESDLDNPISIDAPQSAIRPATNAVPLPKASPRNSETTSERLFVNPARNSRLGAALPSGTWAVRWAFDFSPRPSAPVALLQAKERVLVEWVDGWQLFDTNGKAIASGTLGEGEMMLDEANSLFYVSDPSGLVIARNLEDGSTRFAMFTQFGKGFHRTVLARHENRLLIVSKELAPMTHESSRKAEYTVLEVQDIGSPPQVDENHFLSSSQQLAQLMSRTLPLLTAASGNTLVIAVPDHVYLSSVETLKINADLTGVFAPLSLSSDEAGRIYMLVLVEGRHALWTLTPQGERVMAFNLPADVQASSIPPIIGYDHRVYVAAGSRVAAVNHDGRLLWMRALVGQLAGIVITADDQLLLAAGANISTYDGEGKLKILYSFKDDNPATAPLLTKRGEILVASGRRLYCLTSQP